MTDGGEAADGGEGDAADVAAGGDPAAADDGPEPGPVPRTFDGRVIVEGSAEGPVLFSPQDLSFLGGVDPDTGTIQATDNDLRGDSVKDAVLVFPTGCGSTVGSYIIYRLRKAGCAPAAIVNARADPVIAAGCVMARIPMVDGVPVEEMAQAKRARVEGGRVEVG